MARNSGNITIDVEFRIQQLERTIQKQLDNMSKNDKALFDVSGDKKKYRDAALSLRAYGNAFDSLKDKTSSFSKAMEAANDRVIAFGAATLTINGVRNAFFAMLQVTRDVQKSLKELQVISEASDSELKKYSTSLFEVARNTATSFSDATKAALEFSRQGLTMAQVIERTNDVMIMTRLTGIDLTEAINGLTATINAFSNEDLSSGEILNALSAIDLAAAASTDGIIKGMARSASSARAAGVSFRELASFIATLQETTGLEGGQLGNAAKSIFTRILDPSKLSTLKNLGVKIEADNGDLLETMEILKNIAKITQGNEVFPQKSDLMKFMKDMSGLYQIDKFTSLMTDLSTSMDSVVSKYSTLQSDLGQRGIKLYEDSGELRKGTDILKELNYLIKSTSEEAEKSELNVLYDRISEGVSRFDRNLMNSNTASDEAYQKNEVLNQTLDAQIVKLQTLGMEFGSVVGNVTILDDLTDAFSVINSVIERTTALLQDGDGFNILRAALEGIGHVLTGPGLAIAVATIVKGVGFMGGEIVNSWKGFMKLNDSAIKQAAIAQTINKTLLNNEAAQQAILGGERDQLKVISAISQSLATEIQQTEILARNYQTIVNAVSKLRIGDFSVLGRQITPNARKTFASGDDAFVQEQKAIQAGVGGARQSASPVLLRGFPLNGRRQDIVANTDETIVRTGDGGYTILNRDQIRKLGGHFASGTTPQPQGGGNATRYPGLQPAVRTNEDVFNTALKASLALSMLNGVLDTIPEKTEEAGYSMKDFSKALTNFFTVRMMGTMFGINMTLKGLGGSFGQFGKSFGGAFRDYNDSRKHLALQRKSSIRHDNMNPVVAWGKTSFQNFKNLGGLVKGVAGAFGKLLPVVGWAITVWSILPDSLTDAIKNKLGRAFGLVEDESVKMAKAMNKAATSLFDIEGEITNKDIGKVLTQRALENTKFWKGESSDDDEKKTPEERRREMLDKSIERLAPWQGDSIRPYLQEIVSDELVKDAKSRYGNRISQKQLDTTKELYKERIGTAINTRDWSEFKKRLDAKSIKRGGLLEVSGLLSGTFDDIVKASTVKRLKMLESEIAEKQSLAGSEKEQQDIVNTYADEAAIQATKEAEDIIARIKELGTYKNLENQSKEGAIRFLNDTLRAYYNGLLDESVLKKLGLTPEEGKELRKLQESIGDKVSSYVESVRNSLAKADLLESLPGKEEFNLKKAEIYGSPSDKLKASRAVSDKKNRRDLNKVLSDIKSDAVKLIGDLTGVTGSGFSKENFEDAAKKIRDAGSAKEIKSIIASIGGYGEDLKGLDLKTPKLKGDVLETFNKIQEKELQAKVKILSKALENASDALAQFQRGLLDARIREILDNLSAVVDDISTKISQVDYQQQMSDAYTQIFNNLYPNRRNDYGKAVSDYENTMKKISLETDKFSKELENTLVEKISKLSSGETQEQFLNRYEELRNSGELSYDAIAEMMGDIAKEEEESKRKEIKDRLDLAISEMESAKIMFESSLNMSDAVEEFKKFIGGKGQTVTPQNVLKKVRQVSPKSDIDKTLNTLLQARNKANKLGSPDSFKANEISRVSNNILRNQYSTQVRVTEAEAKKLDAAFQRLKDALDKNVSIQLTTLGGRIKNLSDTIEKARLNIQQQDLNLEESIAYLPSDVQEVVNGYNILNKANRELAVSQLEVAKGNLEHRKSLLESANELTDTMKRASIVRAIATGADNETIVKMLSKAQAEQDMEQMRTNDLFNTSVTDFGSFVRFFGEIVAEWREANTPLGETNALTDKAIVVEESLPPVPSDKEVLAKSTERQILDNNPFGNYDPDTSLLPLPNGGYPESSEIATPMSEFAENVEDSSSALDQQTQALAESYEAINRDTQAVNTATQAQIDYSKQLLEAQKYIDRFKIASNEAATAATEVAKFDHLRAEKINKEGVLFTKGYEGRSFSDALKEATQGFLSSASGSKEKQKYAQDITSLQAELNKRTEFKTFNEGWNRSIAEMTDEAMRLEERMGSMIGTIKDGFVDAFTEAISGAKSFGDAMSDVLQNIAKQIIKEGLNSMISNMFAGAFGGVGQSARIGGSVYASQSGASGAGLLSWFGNLFASGGKVKGGSGTKDDVPALLTGGEYVLNKKSVSKLGTGFLDFLNSGKISMFAKGGLVGRDTDITYLDNGGYSVDISKSNTGAGGYYSPGTYGYGAITGKENLKSFAMQSFTSGQYDVLNTTGSGGVVGLENESWRISALGRNSDTVENQNTLADKQTALGLANQQEAQEKQIAEENRKRRKSLKKALIGAGLVLAGGYVTGAIGAGKSWGLANLFGTNSGFGQSWSSRVNTMQGAFGYGPQAQNRANIWRGLFGMRQLDKQKASGGSITAGSSGRDNTTVSAMQGEYIISRNAAQNVGTPFLDALNNNRVSFADNGSQEASGGSGFSELISKLDEMINALKDAVGGSTGNITINVTDNSTTGRTETSDGESSEENQRLAQKIKNVVLSTIAEEKRVGGMLSDTKA